MCIRDRFQVGRGSFVLPLFGGQVLALDGGTDGVDLCRDVGVRLPHHPELDLSLIHI